MDFQPQIKYILPTEAPMPFFMAYPEYPCLRKQEPQEGDIALQDFEYLRKTYPALLTKWQRRVEEVLDRMDYEGSMIYDEYPDRVSLQDLGEAVARILDGMKQEETRDREDAKEISDPLKEEYLLGLAQVLVRNEVYRRRQKRKQDVNGRITKGFGNGIG
ncbi:MAG: hypothetical protein IK081_13735 [Lachnospiraceae bacterium]|nr:hypothetical protein [Lachnospiraceae bacterium]